MPTPLVISPAEVNWVERNITDLRRYYAEHHKMIHQLRRMRFMRLKARAPQAFQRVIAKGLHSPLSYRLVQTVTGLIAKERPRFTRIPRDKSDRDASSRLQQSADPVLQTLEAAAREPLFWMLIDGIVSDGIAYQKVERHPWAGFPVRDAGEDEAGYNRRVASFVAKGSNQPIRSRLVDPLNMLVPAEEYEPSFQIEQGKRMILSTLHRLNLTFGTNNRLVTVPEGQAYPATELPRGVSPAIDVEELWTPEFTFVRVGGQTLKFENDLGFIPYVNVYGEVSSNMDPAVHSLSVIFPFHGIEPWLNTMLSTLAAWSVLGSVPIMWTSRQAGPGMPGGEGAGALSDLPLGKRIDLGTGGQAGFLQPPPVGREVLEFVNLLVQFLDRAGITPIASGLMGGRTPGTAFDAAMEAALSKLTPLISNAEGGLAEVVKMVWRITDEVLGTPIWVTGMGLQAGRMGIGRKPRLGRFLVDPKDIDGYYDLHCKLKTQSLQGIVTRGMHAAFMKAHKLWSRDRAMRFADVDDTWGEYVDTLRDKLEESPLVAEHILRNAIQEEPELAKMAEELEAQGVDIQGLLTGEEGGGAGGLFGGAGQPRGQPAPGAGGRPSGSPRRPGGRRRGQPQGGQFPK